MPAQPETTAAGPSEFLTDFDLRLFQEGRHSRLYHKLGSHILEREGVAAAQFAVWAPNARSVSLVGDFNGWDKSATPLASVAQSGIWAGLVPQMRVGDAYQYHITSWHHGYEIDKGDPMAFRQGPLQRSFVWDLHYDWHDAGWMDQRQFTHQEDAPISIYQVHLGSWMRVPEEGGRMLNCRELAPKLAEYAKRLGFTHVELLPVMEHASDTADEFEVSGYFAAEHRYGAPQDLMYLIDFLHQRQIGVILDWVGAHFAAGDSRLAYFDGTHLYEHGFWEVEIPADGFGHTFDFTRPEVRSFLLSSAFFWLDQYHADGLRLDSLPTMLYLDHGRRPGEWVPNHHGGREYLEAIEFLKELNMEIARQCGNVPIIGQDNSAWPMLSHAPTEGGLGFGFKWDQSFVKDTLTYFGHDPFFRKFHQQSLTRRSEYTAAEKFILPLSHEEVSPPRRSLLASMPGDQWQRFANLRLLFGFLWLQPGKKLLFMGSEFGQWQAWNRHASLDWHLCTYADHAKLQLWVGDLNRLYREQPALALSDTSAENFEWLQHNDAERSTLAWARQDPDARELLVALCNFTPLVYRNVRIGVRRGGWWREVLNSDARDYGGSGEGNFGGVNSTPSGTHGQPHTLAVTLPPLAITVFKHEGSRV
jgi:1,4-alpha-glucan branching enzyme